MKRTRRRSGFFPILAGAVWVGLFFFPFPSTAGECETAFELAAKDYYQQKKNSTLTAPACRQLMTRFQKIADSFPDCGQADDALYLVGLLGKMAFSLEGNPADLDAARQALAALLEKFPKSPLAEKAQARLKEIEQKNPSPNPKTPDPKEPEQNPAAPPPEKEPAPAPEAGPEEKPGETKSEPEPEAGPPAAEKNDLGEEDLSEKKEENGASPDPAPEATSAEDITIEEIIRSGGAPAATDPGPESSPDSAPGNESKGSAPADQGTAETPSSPDPAATSSTSPATTSSGGDKAISPGNYAQLEAIRYWTSRDYTRVVIELSREVEFNPPQLLPPDPAQALPPRLFIDFVGAVISPAMTDPETPEPGCFTLPIGDGLLKKARAGQFQPEVARVVLDLERIDHFSAFPLPGEKFRYVIGVYGSPPNAPLTPPEISREESVSPDSTPALGDEGDELNQWFRDHGTRTPPGEKKFLVVLDPGHGGKDPGARGPSGTKEKDFALAIAQDTKRRLEIERDDIEVVLTRSDDRYLSLVERTAIANTLDADLFASIHINAAKNRNASGVETYYLDNTTDRAALRLAAEENFMPEKELLDSGDSTNRILADLITMSKVEVSVPLAQSLQRSLVEGLRRGWTGVEDKGVKKAPFWVLTGATMPCALVEVGFISNRAEEKRLLSRAYQEAAAAGIAAGISAYLDDSPHLSRN